MFSPYYAWARRRGPAPAENFCAMNVALYRPDGGRWAMTERRAKRLQRGVDFLQIGPSGLHWRDGVLTAEIEERGAPLPRRMRGRIVLHVDAMQAREFTLDAAGLHIWRPIAPRCRVEVVFDKPELRWSGHAYFDTNRGARPLEADFQEWTWSRSDDGQIYYDVQRQDGVEAGHALQIDAAGAAHDIAPAPLHKLPETFWRMPRAARAHGRIEVARTLEDAPFYARSLLRGASGVVVHESLSLTRFTSPIVQAMLPFRMPRV